MSKIITADECGNAPPAAVVSLHNNMMGALRQHYRHMADGWCISIDTHGGIVKVWNVMLSGKMGFILKITEVDPHMKNVVRLGGELLERYKIARHHAVDMREQMANLKRNNIGEAVFNV